MRRSTSSCSTRTSRSKRCSPATGTSSSNSSATRGRSPNISPPSKGAACRSTTRSRASSTRSRRSSRRMVPLPTSSARATTGISADRNGSSPTRTRPPRRSAPRARAHSRPPDGGAPSTSSARRPPPARCSFTSSTGASRAPPSTAGCLGSTRSARRSSDSPAARSLRGHRRPRRRSRPSSRWSPAPRIPTTSPRCSATASGGAPMTGEPGLRLCIGADAPVAPDSSDWMRATMRTCPFRRRRRLPFPDRAADVIACGESAAGIHRHRAHPTAARVSPGACGRRA